MFVIDRVVVNKISPPENTSQKKKQLTASEHLLMILDSEREYPFDFIVYRITGYRPRFLTETEAGEFMAHYAHLAFIPPDARPANDEIGYILPRSQWDAEAPYAYGRTESQYGEINSVGPSVAPILAEAFAKLMAP